MQLFAYVFAKRQTHSNGGIFYFLYPIFQSQFLEGFKQHFLLFLTYADSSVYYFSN